MDWLYEAEHGNILIITDAGSGWLELSRTRTDQRGTWSDVSEQSMLGLEYHIWLCPITERSLHPKT